MKPRHQPISLLSDSFSSSDSSSASSSAPAIVEDVATVCAHDPQSSDRPYSILEALPEEHGALAKSGAPGIIPQASFQDRGASPSDSRTNRTGGR